MEACIDNEDSFNLRDWEDLVRENQLMGEPEYDVDFPDFESESEKELDVDFERLNVEKPQPVKRFRSGRYFCSLY